MMHRVFGTSLLPDAECCTLWIVRATDRKPQPLVFEELEYTLLMALFAQRHLSYASVLSLAMRLPLALCYKQVQQARETGTLSDLKDLADARKALNRCKQKIAPIGLSIENVLDVGFFLLARPAHKVEHHVEGTVSPTALKQGVWVDAHYCLSHL